MKKLVLSLLVGLFLASFQAFSQDSQPAVSAKFLIEGGIEYGGDELLTVYFTNGEDQTMRAGQGGFIAVGGQFGFPQFDKIMVRTTVGFKYNTTAADNANIRLTRLPLKLMPFWKINDDFRLGIGITSHQSIKLNGDDYLADVAFKSSVGPRVEFGYKWIALTYTAIDYRSPDQETFSASSLGLSVSFVIPDK